MQLVLPKGKVRTTHIVLFPFLLQAISIVFPIFLIMEITVNHQPHQLKDTCSVEQMLSIVLSGAVKGIAVAINQTIVSKSNWSSHLLKEGDQVMLIKATQGG
ncbi:sulfur carrier protein ThiS [Pedobacter sp. ok626]|uniref:sulfur carrier protein ThiS n=1 Tax=Pedobacter sp. ok626 TaxID=1761882 RepID=UPI0020C88B3A|nr:sulfur carrier protein ThiS [Pedobacter sp. ok626]